jgi:hypothetical protein
MYRDYKGHRNLLWYGWVPMRKSCLSADRRFIQKNSARSANGRSGGLHRSIVPARRWQVRAAYQDGTEHLDFNRFCNGQGGFRLNATIPDRAVHLRVTQQQLGGALVASLLVDLGHLRPPHRMLTVNARLKANRRHPVADNARILAGRDVKAFVKPAGPPWFSANFRRTRIAQTCFGFSGRFRPTIRPLFLAGRSARMAGGFGVAMTDPAIRHALPQRQPDVDHLIISKDPAVHLRPRMSPLYRLSAIR